MALGYHGCCRLFLGLLALCALAPFSSGSEYSDNNLGVGVPYLLSARKRSYLLITSPWPDCGYIEPPWIALADSTNYSKFHNASLSVTPNAQGTLTVNIKCPDGSCNIIFKAAEGVCTAMELAGTYAQVFSLGDAYAQWGLQFSVCTFGVDLGFPQYDILSSRSWSHGWVPSNTCANVTCANSIKPMWEMVIPLSQGMALNAYECNQNCADGCSFRLLKVPEATSRPRCISEVKLNSSTGETGSMSLNTTDTPTSDGALGSFVPLFLIAGFFLVHFFLSL